MLSFRTAKELIEARLPRMPVERFNHARKAYLYLILARKGEAKIGQSTNPGVRISDITRFWKGVQEILVIGPTKDWRSLERRMLIALQAFTIRKSTCVNIYYDDFRLPDNLRAAVRECFSAGCASDAVDRLHRIATAPPIDYQI